MKILFLTVLFFFSYTAHGMDKSKAIAFFPDDSSWEQGLLPAGRATYGASKAFAKEYKVQKWLTVVRSGNVAEIEILLKNGVDASVPNRQGVTALHVAVEKGRNFVVSLLLENKDQINVQDDKRCTPLHIAVTKWKQDHDAVEARAKTCTDLVQICVRLKKDIEGGGPYIHIHGQRVRFLNPDRFTLQEGIEEHEQTLNQLLVEMDGFATQNHDVIIIGATNRAEMLDKALLRPGRFDKVVHVPYPDVKSREQILKIYADKLPMGQDVDPSKIAYGTRLKTSLSK